MVGTHSSILFLLKSVTIVVYSLRSVVKFLKITQSIDVKHLQNHSSVSPDQLDAILNASAVLFSYCLNTGRRSIARWSIFHKARDGAIGIFHSGVVMA